MFAEERILALENNKHIGLDRFGTLSVDFYAVGDFLHPASGDHYQYSILMNLCIGCSFSHGGGYLSV